MQNNSDSKVLNTQAPPVVPGSQVLARTGRRGNFGNCTFGVVVSKYEVIETEFKTPLVVRENGSTGEIVETFPVGTVITEHIEESSDAHLGWHSVPARTLLPSIVSKRLLIREDGKLGYEQPEVSRLWVSAESVNLFRSTGERFRVRMLYGNLSRKEVIAGAGESCNGIQCVMPIHPI